MNEKQKILITLPAFQDPGGVVSFYNSLLPHLQNGEYIFKTLEIGSTKGHGNKLYLLSDQLRYYSSLVGYKPDLVNINPSLNFKSFLRDGLLVFQAKLKRLPVAVFFHGWSKDFEKLISNRYHFFFKKTFGMADVFIVLSGDFKLTLQGWGVSKPIHIGTTTVDESLLEKFSYKEKLKKIQQKRGWRILFLARLEKEKGVFETIDAVSLLVQKGLPVSLSIAGDGPIRAELADYIGTKGRSREHIRLLGYVRGQDKINAFVEHDIFCFPTYYGEGLPTSVLEAMAFGLPVITRPVAGLADVFQDEKMGFLCRGKTPAEIADALEKLINDRSLMLKISEYNHTFAKEHFMGPVVAKKITDIYNSILDVTKFKK